MSQAPTIFQRRIVIGAVLCAAAFALVGIRLVHVTLMKSLDMGHAAQSVVARADLTDRNGRLLSRDLPVKDLYARPHVFWDKAEAAHLLAVATGSDERRLLNGFNNAKHPYVLIARQITPDTEAKVMHLGLPGLEFEEGGKRYYPDGRNAAHVVGVTDPDNNGVSGLEMGLQDEIRAAAGGKVATSIDMRVQYILAHEVDQARETFTARARWRWKIAPCAAWTRCFPSARATSWASSPSTKPSICRPPCRRAISWPSPPTSAPPRSCCAAAPRGSANS